MTREYQFRVWTRALQTLDKKLALYLIDRLLN